MKFRTLLIDDEPLALSRLERLLSKHPDDFEVIGLAKNGEEGRKLIEQLKPEVIFLDIEMPALNGFEMLAALSYMPFVVFATAFEEYAIRAFEENSIDYLLKPIEPERLAMTVQKLRNFKSSASQNLNAQALIKLVEEMKPKKTLNNISVKVGDKILLIKTAEVAYLEAEDKYVNLHTLEGKKHLLDYSLTTLESKLSDDFVRVSRSAIINSSHLLEIQKFFNAKYTLILNDQRHTKITSGSTYADKVKQLFEL